MGNSARHVPCSRASRSRGGTPTSLPDIAGRCRRRADVGHLLGTRGQPAPKTPRRRCCHASLAPMPSRRPPCRRSMMAQLHRGSPPAARSSCGASAPSTDLTARELRDWRERSLAVETGGAPPWPERQAAELVDAMVDASLEGTPDQVDAPARVWARTNASLGVLARRLGALRAGFGQQLSATDPTTRARLAAVRDAVAVACTAEWLAGLGLARIVPDEVASTGDDARRSGPGWLRQSRHLREAGVAVLAGAAAAAAVIALATSPHGSRAHVRAQGATPHPTPALVQPPAGGHRAFTVVGAGRPPTTGGPASGRAARGGGGSFANDVGTSGASPPVPIPTSPLPATLPSGVPLPGLPLPSIPSLPLASSAISAVASPVPISAPGGISRSA